MALSQAQQQFVIEVAHGTAPYDAYKKAYPSSKDTTAKSQSGVFMGRLDIQVAIKNAQQSAAQTDDLTTRDGVIAAKMRLYEAAKMAGKSKEANSLLNEIIHLQGVDVSEVVDDPHNVIALLQRGRDHAALYYERTLADGIHPDDPNKEPEPS